VSDILSFLNLKFDIIWDCRQTDVWALHENESILCKVFNLEMGLGPTQAHFWPAVNKRPTRLWLGYFLTRPHEIFFDPKGKILKNLRFWGKFSKSKPKQKMADRPLATKYWPDLTQVKNFRPGPISNLITIFINCPFCQKWKIEEYLVIHTK